MAEQIEIKKNSKVENNYVLSEKSAKKTTFFSKILDFLGFASKSKEKTELNKSDNAKPENDLDITKTQNEQKGGVVTKFFKIKQVKTAIIVLIFSVVALVILSSSFSTSSKDNANNSGYITSLEYCEKLENKLMEVLGNISGVGNIKVMVSVESSPEIKIATSTDERTNTTTNGTNVTTNTTTVSDPVIVNGSGTNNPLILSELSPKITGVIVVAEGAKDVKVRLNLLQAVEAVLNVSTDNIQIYY